MSEEVILHIYYDDYFMEIDTSDFKNKSFSLGKSESNDIVINSPIVEEKHIVFRKENSNWNIIDKSRSGISLNGSKISKKEVVPKDIYVISGAVNVTSSVAAIIVMGKTPNSGIMKKYNLQDLRSIKIGKHESNDIIYSNPLISNEHAKISKNDDGKFHITDLNSTNGIFLNGKRIYESIINPGDVLFICGNKIVFDGNCLLISNIGSGVYVKNIKAVEEVKKSIKPEYPYFQRSPRILPDMPKGKEDILRPPTASSKPTISWLSILLPPLITASIAILMAIMRNSMFMMLSLAMTAGSVLVSVLNYSAQKKKFKKSEKLRNTKYLEAIHTQRKEFEYAHELQRNSMRHIHPDITDCIKRVEKLDRKLWERTLQYNDFLTLRIGIGSLPFMIEIKEPEKDLNLDQDPLKQEPQKLYDEFQTVHDLPICVPLFESGTVGLVGPRHDTLQIAMDLAIQIATHHSYEEVKIVSIFSVNEAETWEWMRWLPHVWDDTHHHRFLANDKETTHQLLSSLYDLIKEREQSGNAESNLKSAKLPHFVFFLSDTHLLENEAIVTYLSHNHPELGISTVFLFDRIEFLPTDCKVIIDLNSKTAEMIQRDSGKPNIQFTPDRVSLKDAEYFARRLAPVQLKQIISSINLPSRVSMLDLLDVQKVIELDVKSNWSRNEPYRSLAAPLGIRMGGEKMSLNLHEKIHGPHGLVAGTTGSGKSELLQSLIISLANNYHPHEVTFVLIDYKGGGMANAFIDLPHLVGTITNLGGNQTKRALVSIKSELKKRQAIFGEYGVNHIDGYQKLYRQKQAKEPLPHLIIVADEFAELKSEQPEFMRELVSAARVGRSLGVHLILATQKPAGVVDDQIWSNARFKLCLKVQDARDSQEMLKRPEAANIRQPGRAYLQVGNNEIFELFQSAWSGADYDPDNHDDSGGEKEILEVSLCGFRQKLYSSSTSQQRKRSEFTQLQVLVTHMYEVAKNEGIKKLNGPWLPPLPETLQLDTLFDSTKCGWNRKEWIGTDEWMCPIIGLVDDPASQSQYPLSIDFGKDGNLLVYGSSGYGKTTLLQTLVISLARTYAPTDVNIYIMDFGGRTLNIFNDLPHCGGIIMMDESEKLYKFIKYILREIDTRKKLFADRSISNLKAYRAASGENMPAIIILIDNNSALSELYPNVEDSLVQITREGGNLGIHIVITASSANAVRYKINANFKMAVALQLSEKSDYTSIVGRTNGLEPSPFNGRGLLRNNPPLEFQTALPTEGENELERATNILTFIKNMSSVWEGQRAKPIPIMPETVYLRELLVRNEVKRLLASKVFATPIGLSDTELEPVFVDLSETPQFLVTGNIQSGKTNFIRAMMITLAMRLTPDKLGLYIIDSNSYGLYPLSGLPHVKAYINSSDGLSEMESSITSSIEQRKLELNEARKNSGGLLTEKEFLSDKQLNLIVVDDLNDFMLYATAETKSLFDRILKKDRNFGVCLVVAGSIPDINSSWEAFVKSFKDLQTGFLFAGVGEQSIFTIRLPYGQAEKLIKSGDGYSINRGKFFGLKSAHLENNVLKAWVDQLISKYKE